MSMFPNAQNPVINGGNFIAAHSIQLNNGLEEEKYAIQTLEQHVTFGAFHNSKDRYDAPKCLPRTRAAVFEEISQWIHVTSSEKPILWLYGPAGAGKSAIAQSVAEKARTMGGLLLGTYFFNRSDGLRNNAACIIPSLAYQIIQAMPCTREHILKAITGFGVFSLNFKTQIEKLILKPLMSAGVINRRSPDDASYRPMLIIVDGLDECQSSNERTGLIQALVDSFLEPGEPSELFPVIILCHSRPESDIRAAFNDPQTSKLSARLVLDNKFDPDSDIQAFLIYHFEEIRAKHILREQIPRDWPQRSIIEQLVRKSSGQFIYASTAIKHIASRRHNPMNRLEAVLGVGGNGSDTSPFKQSDALYRVVLSSVDEEDRSTICRIIGMICFSPKQRASWPPPSSFLTPSITLTPTVIDQVLNLEAGRTLLLIDDLHSLIDAGGSTDPLRPFHASFSDFLHDRSRSEIFYVDPGLPPADHLLAYFTFSLNVPTLSTGEEVSLSPPSRDYFSQASLTVELLEFFERFPWEHILDHVSSGSLVIVYTDWLDRMKFRIWAIWHIHELYTFCKMASKRSLAWVTVYDRALRGLVAWVDYEMALPSLRPTYQESCFYFNARDLVLQCYMDHLLDLSEGSKHPNSELFNMVLDVLQTPGLSCIHYISSKPHNSLILKTILEALVLNQFPHAKLTRSSCRFVASDRRKCCQRCRGDIANLIDVLDRTSYLDALLPYIETEVCSPTWAPVAGQCSSLEELKAAIFRYKKKPIPDHYNYNYGWDADIPSLQVAAQALEAIDPRTKELSDVLPFDLTIFE